MKVLMISQKTICTEDQHNKNADLDMGDYNKMKSPTVVEKQFGIASTNDKMKENRLRWHKI